LAIGIKRKKTWVSLVVSCTRI